MNKIYRRTMGRHVKEFQTGKVPADIIKRLPSDEDLRRVREGGGLNVSPGDNTDGMMLLANRIAENTDILAAPIVIERGFIGRPVSVTTTPVKIIDGKFVRGYIVTNPNPQSGLTTNGTLLASALRTAGSSGNTESVPVGVASYKNASFYLDISATGGGVVQIDLLTQDPLSLNWATAQSDIFGSPSTVGTYYASVGTVGIDKAMAIAWSVSAAGSSTFSLSYILKDGLPGGSTGLQKTIYLGPNQNVNSSTGYPLTEGKERPLFTRPNTEVWAVSLISSGIDVVVFDLQ